MKSRLAIAATSLAGVLAQAQVLLQSVCPQSIEDRGGEVFLTIRGRDYTTATLVRLTQSNRTVALPTRFIDSTELRVTVRVPPSAAADIGFGSASLQVLTGTVVHPGALTIDLTDGTAAFAFCAVEPKRTTVDRPSLPVTVYGYGFGSGSRVFLNRPGTPIFAPVSGLHPSSSLASSTLPATMLETLGPVPLYVEVFSGSTALRTNTLSEVTINPAPTIAPQPTGAVVSGLRFSTQIRATGGTRPFSWSSRAAPNAPAPPGLTITPAPNDDSLATFTFVAPVTGDPQSFRFISVAADASPATPAEATQTVSVDVEALPAVTVQGAPEGNAVAPDQELSLNIGLLRATSLAVGGSVSLDLETAAPGGGNGQIGFISGTALPRSIPYTIPAGCILPACGAPLRVRAGTVFGTLRLRGTIQIGNNPAAADVCTANPAVCVPPGVDLTMAPEPPRLRGPDISVRRSGNVFEMCIPGLTNTRQMSEAIFRFVAAPGRSLQTTTLSRDVSADFSGWFGNAASSGITGGAFRFDQTFTLTGDPQAVGQVLVTLRNSAGASSETGPIDLNTAPPCVSRP
ncbi:MAG: hypothetical protein WD696_07620 [Bryobacteraceae bacterium]